MQNDIASLPELLKDCYKNPTGPYLHFVTTEELIKDLKDRRLNPYSEDVKQQYLNLLELSVPIRIHVCSADIVIELTDSLSIDELHPCVPKNETIKFLRFLFVEIAKNLNDASEGLVLLNHPAYKFTHLDD